MGQLGKPEGKENAIQEEGFNPATEDPNESINESFELIRLSQKRMDNFFAGGLSEEDEAYYNLLELKSKIRDVYNLEKEKQEFAEKMTIAINTIKENPDLLVTENNYEEMRILLKNLEYIIGTFGIERQKELRKSIKGEIGDVVEEIEVLAPNDPNIDVIFNETGADQLVKQEISNYLTYKYNLKGVDDATKELSRKVITIKKVLEEKQPQGFFSKREQNKNIYSEDIGTKKTFYMYHIKLGKGVLGYGITSSPKRRHKEHIQNFADNGVIAEKIYQIRDDAQFIEELELKIKSRFSQVDIGIDGFKNEATSYEHKDEIIDFIDSLE